MVGNGDEFQDIHPAMEARLGIFWHIFCGEPENDINMAA